ncbi:hypothetical protein BT69DRAFT_787394 [Atractiella rhizophila]|nr:hypothetical protein BT69DRAFT_787394 [Atractiella rhizophila]
MESLIAVLDLVHLLIWSYGDNLQSALRLLKVGLRQYQKLYESGLPPNVQARFAELIFVRDSQIAQRMNRLPIIKDSDLEWMFKDTPVPTRFHLTPDAIGSLDLTTPQGTILQVARFALDRAMAVSGVALKNLDAEISENLLKMVDDKRARLKTWLKLHHDMLGRTNSKLAPGGLSRPDLTHSAKALFHYFSICEEHMFKHTTIGLETMWKDTKKMVASEIHLLAQAMYKHLEVCSFLSGDDDGQLMARG